MHTFLRKIRKSLIDSGSVKKYLLYAVGEISLVVIGILIALQINNWNENNKNHNEEVFYLQELQNDFEANKKVLQEIENFINEKLVDISHTLSYMHQTIPDSVYTDDLIRNYYGLSVPELEFSEGALNELLNTGKLHLISNRKLRRNLSNWKNKVSTATTHVSKILKFREEVLRPYMIDCCPTGNEYRNHHLKALNDSKFQTILNLYKLMLRTQRHLKLGPVYELIDEILVDIKNDLGKSG